MPDPRPVIDEIPERPHLVVPPAVVRERPGAERGDGDEGGAPPRWWSWLKRIGSVALVALWIWTCGALHYLAGLPWPLAVPLLAVPALSMWRWPSRRRPIVVAVSLVVGGMLYWFLFKTKPEGHRDWWVGQMRPPVVRFDGQRAPGEQVRTVFVDNVRQFTWRSREDYWSSWSEMTFHLDSLDSLDLVVEPLGDSRWFAHTMLSFGFGPEQRVVVSVEARREHDEEFSMLGGLYKQFELIYQVSSERDAFTLRASDPEAHLYVYPVKATPEFIRGLFVDLMERGGTLTDAPRFYHSLRANCTTVLFDHINRRLDKPIGYSLEVLFPAKAGKRLHELGWMDTGLDYEPARDRFRLAAKVRRFADDPAFSRRIRE